MVKHTSSMPSLAALLGLVAVAGYQNRDKIGDFIKNMSGGGALGGIPGMGGAGTPDVAGGLGGLIDSFRKNGLGAKTDSWVGTGTNEPVTAPEIEKGLGGDVVDQLAAQTGLSRQELLDRLAQVLPSAVDKLTPNGRVPA